MAEKNYQIVGIMKPEFSGILNESSAEFITDLETKFGPTRKKLLELRKTIQQEIDGGKLPDFLAETKEIRDGEWSITNKPKEIENRKVEITGPVSRKMVINALNSGAMVYMADFEDATSPNWTTMLDGQINVRDALNKNIIFTNPTGKEYKLNKKTSLLMFRGRGWHMEEKHFLVNRQPVSGSIFDFALFFYNNYKQAKLDGRKLYLYLPKMEHYLEVKLWNDIFSYCEEKFGLEKGSIKVTVLIETITAVFQMHEFIYELKDYIIALNAGRWDYMFSFIKKTSKLEGFVMPDRDKITMEQHFLQSYSKLLIQTCHKRNIHAMGGMGAHIPIKNNPEADKLARIKIAKDKEREASNGHDGSWVAHPDLVATAIEIFNKYIPQANQIGLATETYKIKITQHDLLKVPQGEITLAGLENNINTSIQYMTAWLRGFGAFAINNLMEDVATAEISRIQVWQWIKFLSKLNDGRTITKELVEEIRISELAKIKKTVGEEKYQKYNYDKAALLIKEIINKDDVEEFLTTRAYQLLE